MPSRSSGNGKNNDRDDHDSGSKASSSSGGTSARTGGSKRGFAAMDPQAQREIAHEGGEAVSRNREHMSEIGRRGAEARNAGRESSRGSSRSSGSGGQGGGKP